MEAKEGERWVTALSMSSEPLLGISFLREHSLSLEVTEGGDVLIAAL